MKQQKRKGFTLVELLVVIAILAILATVSIVGYTAFLKKANVSNDTALAAQINNLLLADETIDGKPGTLGGALAVASENGFDVTKLTPTAEGHDFVYDVANNRFALLDKNGKEVYVAPDHKLSDNLADRWVIRADNEAARPEGYSVYFTKPIAELTLNDGQLVGVEGEITTLNIADRTSAKSVVIAGTIETIEINAPQATIHHYGEAINVNITAVAPQSYHEHGVVTNNITLSDGRVVMEQNSSAAAIDIKATADDITNEVATIYVDNIASPETVIMVAEDVKTAIETSTNVNNELTAAAGSVLAYGASTKAAVGTQTYTSQAEALTECLKNGGTLRLFDNYDIVLNEGAQGLVHRKAITLDLNGNNLSVPGHLGAVGNTASMTIKNGSIAVSGLGIVAQNGAKIALDNVDVATTGSYAICLSQGNNTAVLKNSTISGGDWAICGFGANNNVIIEGCTITGAKYSGVCQNGSSAPGVYNIRNSEISSESTSIYISGSVTNGARQTLVMENCIVKSTLSTAVEIKHTDATITGCTLIASAELMSKENGSGGCTEGYAFAATSNSASDKVTGTITLTDCILETSGASKTFVFQLAEGASVTINGKAAETVDTYTPVA